VTAFGASNRNIALALLVAVGSFAGTPVVGAVVANGLVVILLGLLHVAWWRFVPATRANAPMRAPSAVGQNIPGWAELVHLRQHVLERGQKPLDVHVANDNGGSSLMTSM
jgi:hypothetical protein